MNQGNIVQIIGPVVDVDFSATGILPKIYEALEITFNANGADTKLVLEVQQHLGDKWVRAVAMSSTEGLKRGQKITATGESITVPVGECTLGRIFNVTGDPVDERGPVNGPAGRDVRAGRIARSWWWLQSSCYFPASAAHRR